MKYLIKKIKINTTINVLTGLHIGGSSDSVEIGGIDNPVIKLSTKNNQPYIPGSSLKGKMRCLLEQMEGANLGESGKINNFFGSTDPRNPIPSKLIVRDALLTKESEEALRNCNSLDTPYTENKYENTIDRVKGTAKNPRQTERVPAGAVFSAEFVINVWDDDDANAQMELLKKGIRALECDYLGGSGSRGYGQIKFGELHISELSADSNWTIKA
jgi:CRISPR-associated protein Csm3